MGGGPGKAQYQAGSRTPPLRFVLAVAGPSVLPGTASVPAAGRIATREVGIASSSPVGGSGSADGWWRQRRSWYQPVSAGRAAGGLRHTAQDA